MQCRIFGSATNIWGLFIQMLSILNVCNRYQQKRTSRWTIMVVMTWLITWGMSVQVLMEMCLWLHLQPGVWRQCVKSFGVFCSVALVLKRGRSMIIVMRREIGWIQVGTKYTPLITESALAICITLLSICNQFAKIRAFCFHSLFGFDLFHRFRMLL